MGAEEEEEEVEWRKRIEGEGEKDKQYVNNDDKDDVQNDVADADEHGKGTRRRKR